MTRDKHRSPVPDRARRREIRAHAARLGVPYSVAARLLRAPAARRPEELSDDHRAWLFAVREQRRFAVRVTDSRQAADLPLGRAAHLTERFPPLRDPALGGTALFDGADRAAVLGVLYAVIAVESPAMLPSPAELAWVAELGEETAVDIACAAPDRAARLLLDGDRGDRGAGRGERSDRGDGGRCGHGGGHWRLWTRVEAALGTAIAGADRRMRDAARTLDREFRTVVLRHSVDGARQILDAVLAGTEAGTEAGADAGLAPGTRVRLADGTGAIVVGARWTASGPPTAYDVRTGGGTAVVGPDDVEPLLATGCR
ncbi:hypothetical protein [Virgisporangium aurantiacum]|uniref:Uncharacterized protein n=1 Tax=Virgisporangium aurantiacum TaxID=175570 RepID=A0A8J4E5Y3_9ACTN|nr:hypothetical protein [Virgisporangium aurantiacum]GIJ62578.1 hypothetical protein Vau01_100940 [Virgisporangium aurantiacum]